MLSLLLLAAPSDGYLSIAPFKFRLFLVLTGLFVVGYVLLTVELRLISASRPSLRLRPPMPEAACALLYLFFTALSAAFSPYPGVFWGMSHYDGLVTIVLYVFLFLLLRQFTPPSWLMYLLGGVMCVYCLVGVVQLTGANPLTLFPQGYNYYGAGQDYGGAFWSVTGNTNLCAAILSTATGALLAAVLRAGRRRTWLLLVPLCLTVFSALELNVESGLVALLAGLVLLPVFVVTEAAHLKNLFWAYGALALTATLSRCVTFFEGGASFALPRSALLLAAVGLLFLAAGAVLRRANAFASLDPKKLRRWLLCLTLAALLLAFLLLYFYDGFPDGFLAQAHALLHGHWDDSFGSGRLGIWRNSLALVKERPLLGGGPDTLGLRGLPGSSRFHETLGITIHATPDAAHNEFLNILVNQGLLALLAYLALLGVSLTRWWKRTDDNAAAIAGAAACLYLVQSFFGVSCCFTTPYLWMALAVINRSTQIRKEDAL